MLSGRDTGAIGCANKHCLSCLAMASSPDTAAHNHHRNVFKGTALMGPSDDEGHRQERHTGGPKSEEPDNGIKPDGHHVNPSLRRPRSSHKQHI
ncbi:hypothetical protein SLA2020_439910 [Shorea laevis]